MTNYFSRNVNRPQRIIDLIMGRPRYFLRKTPAKEPKNGRNYHVREKYVTYSDKKLEEIANICAVLGYCAGIAGRIEERNSLERELYSAVKKAKIVLPKRIYDTPEVQKYVKEIKSGLNNTKN